jgi:Tol biopolymer transport system component
MALAYTRLSEEADIWKLEPTGLQRFRLSSTLDERNPQFSPDGKKIVFESRRLGKEQLWTANADGTNPAPLTEGTDGVQGSPSWSPDGLRVAFDGAGPDGQVGILVIEASGGRPRSIASPGSVPTWSHDGKWIYFLSSRTGRREVWRVPAQGGGELQVTHNGGYAGIESPDGKLLYFRRGTTLISMPVGGGPERQLSNSLPGNTVHQYVPVEDGLYYSSLPDPNSPFTYELRFLNGATGTDDVLCRFEARFASGLTVSPDRKTILYSGSTPSQGSDLELIRNFR